MQFNELARLTVALDPSVATFFLGKPGIGKSALASTIGRLMGPEAVVKRRELTGHLPEDISGLPFRDGSFTDFCPPKFFAPLIKGMGPGGSDPVGALILEDITQATRAVQVACFQLVQERSMGEMELSPNVRIILTGNRANDKAGARELPSPLRNRVMLLDLVPDVEEWAIWAGKNGLPGILGGFLTFRPGYFAQTPDQGCKENGQFATPRAWANVGKIYDKALALGGGRDLGPLTASVQGLVGHGVGAEFMAFVKRTKELPDPKAVLDDPVKALPNPPEEADRLAALVTALGEYAAKIDVAKKDKKIHLKFLLALAHCSGKTREMVATGMVVFSANGGSSTTLFETVAANRSDPRVAVIIKHFATSTK